MLSISPHRNSSQCRGWGEGKVICVHCEIRGHWHRQGEEGMDSKKPGFLQAQQLQMPARETWLQGCGTVLCLGGLAGAGCTKQANWSWAARFQHMERAGDTCHPLRHFLHHRAGR